MAVDVGTAWADISLGSLGRVPVSPALPLGILLACMVGLRRLGLDRANLRAWREFLIVGGFVLVFGIWRYSMYVHGGREALGLILAALGEELVYRLAVLSSSAPAAPSCSGATGATPRTGASSRASSRCSPPGSCSRCCPATSRR